MKSLRFGLVLSAVLLLAHNAIAQNANVSTNPPNYSPGSKAQSMTPSGGLRTQPQDGAGNDVSSSHPFPIDCISGCGSALDPVTIVAGTQRGLSIATATTLTIPATATMAFIQAQGTNNSSGVCLYWQDDGTAPTNAAGQAMSAYSSIWYNVNSLPIQLIAASGATCTATISYYK